MLLPVANLPPVGVDIDTSGKFATGVNNNGGK
jgi:hypothetical protein